MDITVIIVSYNVKYFLEQCLFSLRAALGNLRSEVIIVDNNSTDGTIEMLQPIFPEVEFISSQSNLGFGKANNLALQKAQGRTVLFLNPDTILSEKSIEKSIAFLEAIPGSGATGIRMVDGSGKYLKESKRGYPSLWVSFCKMAGLTNLFPNSSLFAGYYLGHKPSGQNHIVDALSGAYLLVKKSVLDITGGFDERFFMYAEDIDLSYRIHLAGFSNHYYSEETIIHFKGESTIKNAAYTRQFYKAMLQFVEKHQKGMLAPAKILLLNTAIRVKTSLALWAGQEDTENHVHKEKNFKLIGDPKIMDEIRLKIPESSQSSRALLCIGPGYSYTEAIGLVEASNYSEYYFHARSSSAAVGSSSKEQRGDVIKLG